MRDFDDSIHPNPLVEAAARVLGGPLDLDEEYDFLRWADNYTPAEIEKMSEDKILNGGPKE
jgi:hypothetical protein